MSGIDVLIINGYIAAATRGTVRGGGNLHVIQLAEVLAHAGRKVVVARGAGPAVEEAGVRYIPLQGVAHISGARVVVLWNSTPMPPGLRAERVAVLASDIYTHFMDVHAEALASGEARLIAVSRWLVDQYTHAIDTRVIPPMLDVLETAAPAKDPNLYVYASAPWKGQHETLELWHRRIAPRLGQARLEVVGVGYAGSSAPSPGYYREQVARAAGVVYVCMAPETYGLIGAMAERYGTRFHCWAPGGAGGLPEALTYGQLCGSEDALVEAVIRGGPAPQPGPPLADLSPRALLPLWEEALFS